MCIVVLGEMGSASRRRGKAKRRAKSIFFLVLLLKNLIYDQLINRRRESAANYEPVRLLVHSPRASAAP